MLFDFVSFIFMVLMENEYPAVGVKIMLIYACLMCIDMRYIVNENYM